MRLSGPLLNIDFERSERLLVPADGVSERIREPFGCEEVRDNSLCELDRLWRWSGNLLIEPEVQRQLFVSSFHEAAVVVDGDEVVVVDRHLKGLGRADHTACYDILPKA